MAYDFLMAGDGVGLDGKFLYVGVNGERTVDVLPFTIETQMHPALYSKNRGGDIYFELVSQCEVGSHGPTNPPK